MDALERALGSRKSTLIFGPLGLQPSTIKFYMNGLPDLVPLSDNEPIFMVKGRVLYMWIEPPFGAVVSPDRWTIAWTSHLNLRWDPSTTRVETHHVDGFRRTPIWVPLVAGDKDTKTLDLSHCTSAHKAFLRLCTFLDRLMASSSTCEWSLKCPQSLRERLRALLPRVGGGPYASYLKDHV